MTLRLLGIFLTAAALALPARAASVSALFLDQIVARSALAFEGTCVENRIERDPGTNLIVTYTTFEVRESLKGSAARTHVIKQVGGELASEGVGFRVQGIPKFVPGEEYVVFLPGVSTAGFSSPVGLGQGRFEIKRDGGGARVGNGRDFNELLGNVPADRLPAAATRALQAAGQVRDMGLEDFKQLVRQLGAVK